MPSNSPSSSYDSVFSTRYGTNEMRSLFSEHQTRLLWRQVWVALATAQHAYGLVSAEELADIRDHQNDIDIATAHDLERELQHDVMAEIKTYAGQCPIGGGKIHLGATSMDIRDNAEVLQVHQALVLIINQLTSVLTRYVDLVEQYADVVCMGYTHLQTAEPLTIGYRFANYAQDLLLDYRELHNVLTNLKGKGIKGAVGTAASYAELLATTERGKSEGHHAPRHFESIVMDHLTLPAFPVTTQIAPRKQDTIVVQALASLAQSIAKIAFDLRVLQSPLFAEMSEPFGKKQVGSSAMPFKRNPIIAERICSLARLFPGYVQTMWHNASAMLLERTLDDSANRRVVIPESFLAASELLSLLEHRILDGLQIHDGAIEKNLLTFGTFAGTERLLMRLVEQGENRQDCHELIRSCSLSAWQAIQSGQPNPLTTLLAEHPTIAKHFSANEVEQLTDARHHIGDAPQRCALMVEEIKSTLGI